MEWDPSDLSVAQVELVLEDLRDVLEGHIHSGSSTHLLLHLLQRPDSLLLVDGVRDGAYDR